MSDIELLARVNTALRLRQEIRQREEKEAALAEYQEQLENIIFERTAKLEAALEIIQQELAEKKRTEEALRQNEEKYRTLFETMAQGVVYRDANGRIISPIHPRKRYWD